jgi:pimeloyl-ACP methyl ester carboxylesterase
MRQRRALAACVAVALCAAACAAPEGNSRPADESLPSPAVSLVDAADALCSATHYALSPDGRFVASWVGRDGLPPLYTTRTIASASITPLDCLGAASCRSWQITQFELFDRLTWGADGQRIFVFDRLRRVHRILLNELATGPLTYADTARLPPGLNDRLLIHGATPSRTAADELARLSPSPLADTFLAYRPSAPTEWRPEIAAFDAGGLVAALVSDARFDYRRVAADGAIEGPLFPRPLANHIQPVRTTGGEVRFAAAGSLLRLDDAVTIESPDPGYAQPVLDADTGAMVGWNSERNIALPENFSWLRRRVTDALNRSESSSLRNVQVLTERDLAWVSLLHFREGEEFMLLGPNNTEKALRCGIPSDDTIGSRRFVLGEGAQRLFLREWRSESTDRGVVVFFHGGPDGTLAQDNYRRDILSFVDAGFRVLAVDYSGSTGATFDLARRLSVRGIDAIRADAALLSEYLNQQSYPNVVVYGASFGSVAAAALIERAPHLVDGVVLVAPYLRYRDPSIWGGRRQMSGRDIVYQRRFDEVFVAQPDSRRSVARWLQGLPARWPANIRTLLVFGELDPVSQAADWIPVLPKVSVIEFPAQTHEGVLVSSTTRDEVAHFLDGGGSAH